MEVKRNRKGEYYIILQCAGCGKELITAAKPTEEKARMALRTGIKSFGWDPLNELCSECQAGRSELL